MAQKKSSPKKVATVSTLDELKTELLTLQNDLVEARRSHAARELANTNRLSELRRSIARAHTAINQRLNEEKKNA